jgi:hypothetical protein
MRTHTNERGHSCNHCSRTFREACALQVHSRSCGSCMSRPFACGVAGCGYTATQKAHLEAHAHSHTASRWQSHAEERIRTHLTLRGLQRGVDYTTEQTFSGLIGEGGGRLRFDFALPISTDTLLEANQKFLFIEADGIQHTMRLPHEPETKFARRKEHDRRKEAFARGNGHILIRIPHTQFRSDLLAVAVDDALNLWLAAASQNHRC